MRRQASLPARPRLTPNRPQRTPADQAEQVEGARPRPGSPFAISGTARERLLSRVALIIGVTMLALAGGLLLVRATHQSKVYPAVYVADVPVGGKTMEEATALVEQRAAALESSTVTFTHGGVSWSAPLKDLGLTVNPDASASAAFEVGRESDPLERTGATLGLLRGDEHLPLQMQFDEQALGAWFDRIDRELGVPPRDASLKVEGTTISVVPEQDGTVVDREAATGLITSGLRELRGTEAALPTIAKTASVRVPDLAPAQAELTRALANPMQVTFRNGRWTLPATDLGQFVRQEIDPARSGADAVKLTLDKASLANYLEQKLAPEIDQEPEDAQVGWNGERVVSVVPSADGVHLESEQLAALLAGSFFGDHAPVEAPATITPPTIDSNNLDKLGITTLMATGSSNYLGSTDGRAINVQVGADLLNGTLVPPHGTFSFNNAIGYIDEDAGFVEAQVITGESIGKDIGGGICQVSTTVFRAAYLAGLPITEWWPHRFRIGFYELDGWEPGLDASILQPSADPSTWGDFKFENPSDHWLLVESWADGARVIVNIYGPDLGYKVESVGPTRGQKFQMLRDEEVVDPELDPGTINQTMSAAIGEEISHYRTVYDRNGDLLWERSFYVKYYPKGNVWKVSPDMQGKSPAEPNRELPPLPVDPPENAPEQLSTGAAETSADAGSGAETIADNGASATDPGASDGAGDGSGEAPAA